MRDAHSRRVEPGAAFAEGWNYNLQVKDDELFVTATFPRGVGPLFRVAEGGGVAIRNLRFRGSPRELTGDTLSVPECKDSVCTFSYTFAYKRFALGEQNLDTALWSKSFAILQPRIYLLHPTYGPFSHTAKICAEKEVVIAAEKRDGCYVFPAIETIERVPYSTIGPVSIAVLGKATSRVQLIAPTDWPLLPRAQIWATRSADAVTSLYGGFPLVPTQVSIVGRPGAQVHFGFTRAATGGSIVMHVGEETDDRAFAEDWMLTHEMVHLGFPSLPISHRWIEEGFATYGELLAKRESGQASVAETWGQLTRYLPTGAAANDRDTLERAVTWSRIYWGGAAAWFSFDVALAKVGKAGVTHLAKRLHALGHHDGTVWTIAELSQFVDAETEKGFFERYVLAHHSRAIPGVSVLLRDLRREDRARIVRE